jgi:hypothetical protein
MSEWISSRCNRLAPPGSLGDRHGRDHLHGVSVLNLLHFCLANLGSARPVARAPDGLWTLQRIEDGHGRRDIDLLLDVSDNIKGTFCPFEMLP